MNRKQLLSEIRRLRAELALLHRRAAVRSLAEMSVEQIERLEAALEAGDSEAALAVLAEPGRRDEDRSSRAFDKVGSLERAGGDAAGGSQPAAPALELTRAASGLAVPEVGPAAVSSPSDSEEATGVAATAKRAAVPGLQDPDTPGLWMVRAPERRGMRVISL